VRVELVGGGCSARPVIVAAQQGGFGGGAAEGRVRVVVRRLIEQEAVECDLVPSSARRNCERLLRTPGRKRREVQRHRDGRGIVVDGEGVGAVLVQGQVEEGCVAGVFVGHHRIVVRQRAGQRR